MDWLTAFKHFFYLITGANPGAAMAHAIEESSVEDLRVLATTRPRYLSADIRWWGDGRSQWSAPTTYALRLRKIYHFLALVEMDALCDSETLDVAIDFCQERFLEAGADLADQIEGYDGGENMDIQLIWAHPQMTDVCLVLWSLSRAGAIWSPEQSKRLEGMIGGERLRLVGVSGKPEEKLVLPDLELEYQARFEAMKALVPGAAREKRVKKKKQPELPPHLLDF